MDKGGSTTLAELNAYKDGITDALLEGYRCDSHDNLYYYKRGYEFGIHLYNQIKEEKYGRCAELFISVCYSSFYYSNIDFIFSRLQTKRT